MKFCLAIVLAASAVFVGLGSSLPINDPRIDDVTNDANDAEHLKKPIENASTDGVLSGVEQSEQWKKPRGNSPAVASANDGQKDEHPQKSRLFKKPTQSKDTDSEYQKHHRHARGEQQKGHVHNEHHAYRGDNQQQGHYGHFGLYGMPEGALPEKYERPGNPERLGKPVNTGRNIGPEALPGIPEQPEESAQLVKPGKPGTIDESVLNGTNMHPGEKPEFVNFPSTRPDPPKKLEKMEDCCVYPV